MGNIFYFAWEPQLMAWLQQTLGSVGAFIASYVSALGEETVMVGIMGFIYWCIDKRWGSSAFSWSPGCRRRSKRTGSSI